MGWFTSKSSDTPMNDLQKSIVVSISGTFIGEDHPNFDYLLDKTKRMIGITDAEFNKNIETLNTMIPLYGIHALNSFETLSKVKRQEVKEIFTFAFENGININVPEVQFLYKEAVRKLRV